MAFCDTGPCFRSDQHLPRRLFDEPLRIGDVYAVDSSTSHPLQMALANSTGLSQSAMSNARTSLTRLMSTPTHLLPRRPALICRPQRHDRQTRSSQPFICLMGTFGGDDIKSMPRFLQHFLVPVHPTISDKTEHLHTSPEWEVKTNQWICAAPYRYPLNYGLVTERWLCASGDTHYRVPEDVMEQFDSLCQEKRWVWINKNPNEKNAWAVEYQIHLEKEKMKRRELLDELERSDASGSKGPSHGTRTRQGAASLRTNNTNKHHRAHSSPSSPSNTQSHIKPMPAAFLSSAGRSDNTPNTSSGVLVHERNQHSKLSPTDTLETWRSGHARKSQSDDLTGINERMTTLLVEPSEMPVSESEVQLDEIPLEAPILQLPTASLVTEAPSETANRDSKRFSVASTMVASSEASGTVGSEPVSPSGLNSDTGYSPEKGSQRTTALPPLTPQPVTLVEPPQPITVPHASNNTPASANLSAHTSVMRQNIDAPSFDSKKSGVFMRVVGVANALSRKTKRQAAKARKEASA